MARPSLVLVPRPSSSTMILKWDQQRCSVIMAYFIQAALVDIAHDESNLSHLSRECRNIVFNDVVGSDPGK